MKKISTLLFLLFVIINLAFCLTIRQEKVLILSSYSDDYIWQSNIKNGIKEKLSSKDVLVYEENFQCQKLSVSYDIYYPYFKTKYSATTFSLVIVLDDYAFQFIKKYSENLFPGTPVVFCGVNNVRPQMLKEYPLFTGVNEKIDFKGTIELLLKIKPETQNVYMFGDGSEIYKINKTIINDQIKQMKTSIVFHFIDDKRVNEIQSLIKKMKSQDAIVIVSSIKDEYGQSVFPHEKSVKYFTINPDVPVFGLWDFYLSYGVIGGSMVSSVRQGELAGVLALEILNSKSVKNIPVIMNSPNIIAFDYNQLRQFKIKVKSLPLNAEIINQPSSRYFIQKEVIWVANLFFVLIVTFLLIFLYQYLQEKKVKKDLDNNLSFMKTLLDTIPNPIYFRTLEGEIKLFNNAYRTFFQLKEEDLRTKCFYEVLPENVVFICKEADNTLMKNPPRQSFETIMVVNNEEKHVRLDKAIVYDLNNNIQGIVGIITDVSERNKSDMAIKDYIQSLEMKNNEMQAFLYTISHDLKSPIITIKGFLAYLYADIEKQDHFKIQRGIKRISDATDKMTELLDDLLALSRVGRKMPLHSTFTMNDSVKEAVSLLQALITETNAQITVQECMPTINADRKRIREVWQNLIENAIKYSKETGYPVIQIGCEHYNDHTYFFIKDNGIGIEKDNTEKVFGLFEKLNPNSMGSGIGLALVKKILEMHQGKVWVEEWDNGSIFKFYLNKKHVIK